MRDLAAQKEDANGPGPLGSEPWEQDLLHRFRNGESAAFGQLLRYHQTRVFSLICRLVARRDEAEELMQEAFLQAFRLIGRFPEVRPFRPWLFRVAVNVCRNHLRAASRREAPGEFDDAVQPLWQDRPETPEQEAVSGAELERLERALSHLSIEDRSLFLLRCREGLPYEELGEILGVRASALRVRYHRVLQRLRGLIHGAVQ